MNSSRRKFIRNSSMLALAGLGSTLLPASVIDAVAEPSFFSDDVFSLPSLPYAYDALEPHIDKLTMEIHHTKHHKAYVDNLNKAVKELKDSPIPSLEMLVKNASKYSVAIRNHGGGHWNHSFFWKLMKPNGGGVPEGKIATEINNAFGSFDAFKIKMEEASMKRFGSGWAWLVLDADNKLAIGSTPNQDNPLMDLSDFKGKPLLGIDVWEHAYYLKYQNKRADYVKAWWNLLNWEEINKNL